MLRVLEAFSNALEEAIPKPSKAYGTCWIDQKFWAMEIILNHYGSYMAHIESLSLTDSQTTKRAELEAFMKKWKYASFPIHTAIFLDLFSLIRRLSITFQSEEHNLVKTVQRIEEFNWTMDELKILTESSLEDQNTRLTHYKQFLGKIGA